MKNCAIDLVIERGPAAAVRMEKELRVEKFFKGGIGSYSNFVHVEKRSGSN